LIGQNPVFLLIFARAAVSVAVRCAEFVLYSYCMLADRYFLSLFVVHIQLVGLLSAAFLQRGRIACNAERCNTYGNSVRPPVCLSVRLSHAGTLSRRMKIESRGLHCEVAKTP